MIGAFYKNYQEILRTRGEKLEKLECFTNSLVTNVVVF